MLKKVKELIRENRRFHEETQLMLDELLWAETFHDSIRGMEWVEKLNLNIGRWAGGYNLFYLLNRILGDYKPVKILELGLGETTKFISTYAENNSKIKLHTIIEQDADWKNLFEKKFVLSKSSEILLSDVEEITVNGFQTKIYSKLSNKIKTPYDLYLIDGPKGSKRYSRYDILNIAEDFNIDDEFVIVFDDAQRLGEKDTINKLITRLNEIGIKINCGSFKGKKNVFVIATEQYRHIVSI